MSLPTYTAALSRVYGGIRRRYAAAFMALVALPLLLVAGCATSPFSGGPGQVLVTLNITSASVQTGTSEQFTATVQNSSNQTVVWEVNGVIGGNTSVGTITNGKYTAPFVVPTQAVVTILAMAAADSSKTGSAQITITPPANVSVKVTQAAASTQIGAQQLLSATVTNDPLNLGVTWALSGAGCTGSACGTLSSTASASGAMITYTAPGAVPSPATIAVTATAVADGSKSGAAMFTITPPPAIAVTVLPNSATVQTAGGTTGFSATVTNDAQNRGVSWTLSGTGCTGAACGTLSSSSSASGVAITFTAPAALPSPAAVTLTATSVSDGTKLSTAAITLTAPPAIAVVVSPASASVVAPGGTKPFTATVSNDAQNRGVTWALSGAGCSGTTCGTLSSSTSASGVAITYLAPAALPSPAAVTLTATSVSNGTKSAGAAITLAAPPPITVAVSPSSATLQAPSGTQPFTATLTNDTQNQGVSWVLSGTGCNGATCGTLSTNTSASGVAITYTAPTAVPTPGAVTLTATSVSDGTKSAASTITLTSMPVGNITVAISPKRGGLTLGQSFNVTATVTNDVGAAGVNWSASGASCTGSGCGTFASVTTTSATFVAPAAAGVVSVTATSIADGSKSASATVGVTDLAGVFTYHNDLARDGANTQEYALTIANVTSASFGRLFTCPVDGAIYAQPLWVANLSIGGVKRNVVFVATTHDSVYAFDADASPCQQLWTKSLLPGTETFLTNNDVGTGDIQPDIGIIGTPVIDPASNTLYVVSKSKSASSCSPSSNCHQRLHGLSLIDGSEAVAPTDITSAITVAGTGDGSSNGTVNFEPLRENERAGLTLVNGVVYVAWASHGDNGPYHGWVMGFDKSTLQIVSTWNANPNGSDSGIWMSGGAPSADSSGNLYFLTGNGTFDAASGGLDYGDSTVKLSTASGLAVSSYFTPADQQNLEGGDTDHGSGGAAILLDQPMGSPHQHLMIGGGKEGNMFLLNRDSLGGYGANANPVDSNTVQKFSIGNGIFATAAFWNNALYIAGIGPLKTFAFNTTMGTFGTAPTSQSSNSFSFPGATPSISATGASSNGIVWALYNNKYCTQQSSGCSSAVLHAYDATNLNPELWNSGSTAGNAVKFTVPTVANGKVYVGTRGNNTGGAANTSSTPGELEVYGLLPN